MPSTQLHKINLVPINRNLKYQTNDAGKLSNKAHQILPSFSQSRLDASGIERRFTHSHFNKLVENETDCYCYYYDKSKKRMRLRKSEGVGVGVGRGRRRQQREGNLFKCPLGYTKRKISIIDSSKFGLCIGSPVDAHLSHYGRPVGEEGTHRSSLAVLPICKHFHLYQRKVFFATTHGGSGKVPIAKIATRIATAVKMGRDNAFMEALSPNSLCGETTRKDFINGSTCIVMKRATLLLPTKRARPLVDKDVEATLRKAPAPGHKEAGNLFAPVPQSARGSLLLTSYLEITHFFLRWRQDRVSNVHPMSTSAFFLLNGFPHSHFRRVYGLSNEHYNTRETSIPHVKYLSKCFEKKLDSIEDEELLVAIAALFLHASNVPEELQPPCTPSSSSFKTGLSGIPLLSSNLRLLPPYLDDMVCATCYVRFQYKRLVICGLFSGVAPGWGVGDVGTPWYDQTDFQDTHAKYTAAARYVAHLRERVWGNGPKISMDDMGNVSMFVDDRFHLPTHIPSAWIILGSGFLNRRSHPPCDLLRFAASQLSMLAFQAIRDRHILPLDGRLVASNIKTGVVTFAGLFSPESTAAATCLFMMLYEYKERGSSLTHVDVDLLQKLLDDPVTKRNYYFRVKLIDAWMWKLWNDRKADEVERLLLRGLKLFTSAPNSVQQSWGFGLDPILDVLEFLIVYYDVLNPNVQEVESYRGQYTAYFEDRYHDWIQRLALGCGVGVFGMSFSRLRIESVNIRLQMSTDDSLELHKVLQRKFGRSGTSFPDGNKNVKRYVERDWAHFRYSCFMQVFGVVEGASTTFGEMEFGGMEMKAGISKEAYDAERMVIAPALTGLLLDGDLTKILGAAVDSD
ncbi:hypothetical protein BCR34DRAFT_591098 [Clohesyomyces aquaticus]|uniref:Uncharacterized protein n=1 Tax=Clohesyomyces aquaticus TaxID=1231657 RepID=A0A1Y1Z3A4_9PLEO|nr:hypothetical protein BCR34DRAFT_591098 [Clohesyomyces aquaticus]